ncbi:retrotransposon protein, putative, ty1-copia subclass [Tanacetum coccineum]
MFEKQARVERFDLIQTFHACKQEEGKPLGLYVLKMKGYVEQLECLGYVLPQDISVGLILNGLTSDFAGFGKGKGKGKDKSYIPKPKNLKPSTKERLAKDDAYHHCKEVGHWKMNFPVYLDELIMKKKQVGTASSSSIFTIELFFSPKNSWVYDTGCGTHICNTKQGLKGARKLKQGALYLYMGNGVRAQVEAIGSYDLVLPNGLVICLDNCHYAPTVTRGVVLVSRLVDNEFTQCLLDYEISVSKNDVLYFNVISSNGIYEIDMINRVPNDYALETATRILNMVPTKKVDKTPYELWYGKVPNLSYLKVWGCEALVKRDTPDKLQQRSVKCIFIGYPKETMGYYFYFPPENKIVVARYAEFLEKNLLSQEISGRAEELKEIQDEDTSPSKNTSEIPMEVEGFEPPQEEVVPIRRSARTHQAPDRLCLNVEVEEHSLGDLNEPTNYKAAILDLESDKWLDAMNTKMQSMKDNQVWHLVDLPPNCGGGFGWLSWWLSHDSGDGGSVGVVVLVVAVDDGSGGVLGVAEMVMTMILIAIAAFYDYEIWQMDIKTAFLNGYLDEDIYMVQPEGFVDPNHPKKVCKLQRSIYSLKQASRSWNKIFDEEIKRFRFAQNLDEPCVYQKASGSNVTFFILYVDDIIIMGNHIPSLQSVKTYLGKCFAMKDLGEAAFILKIKIY